MLVYALGGGRGHAVRGCSVARALARGGAAVQVLVRTPEVAERLDVPHVVLPRPADADALRIEVLTRCERFGADALVLDTFPDGLLGELAATDAGPRRLGLLRCRKDASSPGFMAGLGRLHRGYDLEPHLAWLPPEVGARVIAFGPITRLVEGAQDEPRTQDESRTQDEPRTLDVLVVASEPELCSLAQRLVPRLRARGLAVALASEGRVTGPGLDAPDFPLPAALLRARVLVGPAGFNLGYEALALRTWHVAIPRPRSHDDQRRRAEAIARVVHGPVALERLVVHLAGAPPPVPTIAVHSADRLAARLLADVGSGDDR